MDYENMISALREGNIPDENMLDFCVGRDDEIGEFKSILEKSKNDDASKTKFIEADYGGGKSNFLKIIEEMAFKDNFVVSNVLLSNVHLNKLDDVYKSIVGELRCKTGTSLNHIIQVWISELHTEASEEYPDNIQKQLRYVEDEMKFYLNDVADYANSFSEAIINFYRLTKKGDYETANYALAWLRGNKNIPASIKKKFGVKGDISKEDAHNFLIALSIFIKTIGYSGLVILFDETEYCMQLHTEKIRNTAYYNMRDFYDYSSKNKYKGTVFVFAGTSTGFHDPNRGVKSYSALYSRIDNPIHGEGSVRNPLIELKGFKNHEMMEIASKIIEIHEKAYNWSIYKQFNDYIPDIIEFFSQDASLVGGYVNPRRFIKTLVACLDKIELHPDEYKTKNDVLSLLGEEDENIDDEEDDW